MNNYFKQLVYNTGVSDWFNATFSNKWRNYNNCPAYWRGKPEERVWRAGYNYAKGWNKK